MGRLMQDLVIVGDEAWTREEWDKLERRRAYERDLKRRRYHEDPEFRAKVLRANRRWKEKNLDHRRAYERQWARDKRDRAVSDATLRRRIKWHRSYIAKYEAELRRRLEKAA
jgi:hypothetical protein